MDGATTLILKMFDMIFGSWVSAALLGTDNPTNISLVAELLSYANIMAMMFAALITGLFAFGGTVNAAVKGSIMGDRWSGGGSVISMVVASSMVLPVNLSALDNATRFNGQVSGSQLLVLQLAKSGSDLADLAYSQAVSFFQHSGFNSGPSGGDLTPALSLTRAHLCALAGLDDWSSPNNIEASDLGNGSRDISLEKSPYRYRYVAEFRSEGNSETQLFETFNQLQQVLNKVNEPITENVMGERGFSNSKKHYLSKIHFGGSEGACGFFTLPPLGSQKIQPVKSTDGGALVVNVIASLERQTIKDIRQLVAELITNTHADAQDILYTALVLGEGKAGNVFYDDTLNTAGIDKESLINTDIKPLAKAIFVDGAAFFQKIAALQLDVSSAVNGDDLIKEMRKKGWLAAGGWALEMSRISSVQAKPKLDTLSLSATKGGANLCAGPAGLYATISSWFSEEDCPAKIFMGASWLMFSEMAVEGLKNDTLDLSPIENYYLRRSAFAKSECSASELSSGGCAQSTFEAVIDTTNLLSYIIWNAPEERGIRNPPEPISYISDVGNNMLAAAVLTNLRGLPIFITSNYSTKSSNALVNFAASVVQSLLSPIVALLQIIIMSFWISGYMLSFVLPLIPVIHWIMGIFSWVITVVIAYAAIPLAVVMIIIPTEQGFQSAKKQRVIQILASVFLRPILLLFGLFVSLAVAQVGLGLFNEFFWAAADVQKEVNDGSIQWLFRPFAIYLIATSAIISLIRHSFSIMHTLPNEVLKTLDWFSDRVFGDEVVNENWSDASSNAGAFATAISGNKTKQ